MEPAQILRATTKKRSSTFSEKKSAPSQLLCPTPNVKCWLRACTADRNDIGVVSTDSSSYLEMPPQVTPNTLVTPLFTLGTKTKSTNDVSIRTNKCRFSTSSGGSAEWSATTGHCSLRHEEDDDVMMEWRTYGAPQTDTETEREGGKEREEQILRNREVRVQAVSIDLSISASMCVCVCVCVCGKQSRRERERAGRRSVWLMCWSLPACSVSARLLSVSQWNTRHLSRRASNHRVEPEPSTPQRRRLTPALSSRSSPMSVYFRSATPTTSGPRTAHALRSPPLPLTFLKSAGESPANDGPNRAGIRAFFEGPEMQD